MVNVPRTVAQVTITLPAAHRVLLVGQFTVQGDSSGPGSVVQAVLLANGSRAAGPYLTGEELQADGAGREARRSNCAAVTRH